MLLGRLLLRYRLRFGHGFRTAYYRDVVRPRILRTPPVVGLTDDRCEIHVLTSATDWLNALWSLKSFYAATDKRYLLCLHDDGSLSDEHRRFVGTHFPDARFIPRKDADEQVMEALRPYPRCRAFRATNLFAPRVFDFFHFASSERLLQLDSDVLFFAAPTALEDRIDADTPMNAANRDLASAYTVEPSDIERRFGFRLIERFNAGLSLLHRSSVPLDWVEEFLGLPGILAEPWRVEQTLFALCSSRFGVELLPHEYDVRLTRDADHGPARHYVGAIRHLMYRDGVRRLARQGLLKKKGRR